MLSDHSPPPEDKHVDSIRVEGIRVSTNDLTEDQIDEQLAGTFPASDPPSWTLGVESSDETPAASGGDISPRHLP